MVLAIAWRRFSGTSSEHGVSCLTGYGVLSALIRDRFDVVGIGITRTGRWILVDPGSDRTTGGYRWQIA
mgnify:CR=1 FL=1